MTEADIRAAWEEAGITNIFGDPRLEWFFRTLRLERAIKALARRIAAEREAVPVPQFRKEHCADWYDGYADHNDGGGPYQERTLYTHPPKEPTDANA